jgi:hypothetical protein
VSFPAAGLYTIYTKFEFGDGAYASLASGLVRVHWR